MRVNSMSTETANAVKTDASADKQTTLTTYAQFAAERADTATDDEECPDCTEDLACFEYFELEDDQ